MKPTVSMIVPVYNADQTLGRCVDSVLNQEYEDFELLLMDDGSADESGKLCDEYAKKDPRVRVVHKENTGVSDTRNQAIKLAQGEFLQFLDSDDWITPDATKLMVRSAREYDCDLVVCDFYRVVGERLSRKGDIDEEGVLTREEFAAHMMENPADFYYGVLWNKLYRRDIVEKHKLSMNAEISWCEDFMFNLEYMRYAETFYALQAPVYYYVKRKGSLVSQGNSISNTVKMKLMVFEYYNNFYKHVLDEEEYEKNRLQVYRFLVDAAGDSMVLPVLLPGTKKLGEERSVLCPEAVAEEGIAAEFYRNRKLMERYLETAALKNSLSLTETKLLLCLSQRCQWKSRRELADFVGISQSSLSLNLQKLSVRGLLKSEDVKGVKGEKKQLYVTFLAEAASVLEDLAEAQMDYDQARLSGFTQEELLSYASLSEKIKTNIQRVLQ